MPKFAFASESSALLLSPALVSAQVGSTFDLTISGVSSQTTIDTVRAVLSFDPAFVRAQEVALLNTFNRSAPGNYIDNKQGIVSWGAFTLDRPTQGAMDIAVVTFFVLKEGETTIDVRPESKMIHDGTETANPSAFQSASLKLEPSKEVSEDTPIIHVSSASHPDPLRWYQQTRVDMEWIVLPNQAPIKQFFTAFDESSQTDPAEGVASTQQSVSYAPVNDGTHYFHIKGVLENGSTTPTVHTQVKIDTIKPNDFVITPSDTQLIEGETLELTLATTDEPSGVVQYLLAINDGTFEATDLPIVLPQLTSGTYFLRVAAVDRAGNTKYASTSVRVYPQGTDLHRPIGYNDSKEIIEPTSEKQNTPTFLFWMVISLALFLVSFFFWKRQHRS